MNPRFVFRQPTRDPDPAARVERRRAAAIACAEVILEAGPVCADPTAALRKVREATRTANAAISRPGRAA